MTRALAKQTSDYEPTDIEGNEAAAEDEALREEAVARKRRREFAELLRDESYRRELRARLRDAHLDVRAAGIDTVYRGDSDYGAMCYREGRRIEGLALLWQLLTMLGHAELPIEVFRQFWMESEE